MSNSLFKKALFGLGMMMVSTVAFAQGAGHSGGGNVTEADLKHFMNKLSVFLQSNEGLTLFPEVKQYNDQHPKENFYQVIAETNPVIVDEKVYDQKGVERDCMSYALPGNRFFKCNKDALPSNELNNQPSLYRILLHELFVQAGIESPVNDEVRSTYAVSSRIMDNIHLETYQEWVPGKPDNDFGTAISHGVECRAQGPTGDGVIFLWYTDGRYLLAKDEQPQKKGRSYLRVARMIARGQGPALDQVLTPGEYFEVQPSDSTFKIWSYNPGIGNLPYIGPGWKHSHFVVRLSLIGGEYDNEIAKKGIPSNLSLDCQGIESAFPYDDLFTLDIVRTLVN